MSKGRWMAAASGISKRRRRRAGARGAPLPLEHRILLTATLCLLATGAVMVFSASSSRSLLSGQGDGTGYLVRFVVYGGFGLVVMQMLARHGLELVQRVTPMLLGVAFVLLVAVKVPGIGVSVNGARRWIGAGPLQFQPSELMKLALLLYSVHLLAARPLSDRRLKAVYKPLALVTGSACLLVLLQPDMGTALVVAFTLVSVLIAAGVPLRHLAIVAVAGLALVAVFALIAPYRRARLTSFLNPWAHAGSTGFQAVQGQIALGSGGLLGRGPGQSVQKIFYLPEAHTDFILAVIGEELGAAGVCCLLFLYGLVSYAGLRAAKAARGSYASLLAVGLTSLIVSQALLNVFAVLGLAPLTGVPLPFVSYGASNLVVMLAAMGMLLHIASGRAVHLRSLRDPVGGARDALARESRRWKDERAADSDRSRRDRRARGARAGGR
jgi:cell division protein FtsW